MADLSSSVGVKCYGVNPAKLYASLLDCILRNAWGIHRRKWEISIAKHNQIFLANIDK